MFEKKADHSFPDRPLDCGECKRPIAVRYTEIAGDSIVHTSMCADCPELQHRLHGAQLSAANALPTAGNAGVACGHCGTTLEEIKRGHTLGCPDCYTVFEELLIMEMQAANRLSPRIALTKKNASLHIGRRPGEPMALSPSSRLLALNEALKETLRREDYEQAAWLRDQIKALTESSPLALPREENQDG